MKKYMGRLFKYILFALAFVCATFTADMVRAQSTGPTPTASPSPTATEPVTSTLTATASADNTLTATTTSTTPSATVTATQTQVVLPTPSPTGSAGVPAQPTTLLTQTALPQDDSIPLEGTIIANRSEIDARFFLEGATYLLEAGRSQGIDLPRTSTVINLFNCPAEVDDSTAGCFWDPYLLQQDGFYEIYDSSSGTTQAKLMLREAGAPPTAQVWIQNRTGQSESVVFKEEVYEILPATVLEIPVEAGLPAIIYVRSCLSIDNQSACEWAPKILDSGVYYAMVELDTPGSDASITLTTIDLRPVVGEGAGEEGAVASESEEAAPGEVASASTLSIVCNVVVPALNVRSGPGLQYDIIGKVRTTEAEATTVVVIGRSEDNQWLVVDASVADQGWINNSPSFIECSGDLVSLPVSEASAPLPTPQPVTVAQPPVATAEAGDVDSEDTTPEETASVGEEPAPIEEDAAAAIPPGQSLLVITNGFQHEMRFTIDQSFRPQEGPSEYDLQPAGSVSIVVYPGDIAFTGSSPWSGLSGNASITVEPDQALNLWLHFELDADGSWEFRWN